MGSTNRTTVPGVGMDAGRPGREHSHSARRTTPATLVAGAAWLALCAVGTAVAAADARAADAAAAPAPVPRLVVQRLQVDGNTLLDAATVDAALALQPGAHALADLEAAAQRLQQAYRTAGYGAVVVQVPAQAPQQGVVRIEVIEGRLSQTSVSGALAFSRDNVLRGLPSLQPGRTPRLDRLDAELLMVNENPAKSAHVVFQPGQQRGQVEALVVVDEQPPLRAHLALDNTGSEGTGPWRLAADLQHANLLDRDIVGGLRYVTSPSAPERVQVASASLRVPLYAARLFIELNALGSNTRNAPSQTPAGELRFAGRGESVGARALWTLAALAEAKQQLAVGVEARRYRNDCAVGDLGTEGCGTAAAPVDVLPLTVSWTLQRPGQAQLMLQAVANLGAGRAGDAAAFEAARAGARPHYRLLRADASGQALLARQVSLQWRASAQFSDDALVSAEQFGLGGAGSVRGYTERALAGDRGVSASLELATRLSALAGAAGPAAAPVGEAWWQRLQLSAFMDGGLVAQRATAVCRSGHTSCGAWGAGLGLQWADASRQVRLDLARAGAATDSTPAGHRRGHLSLRQSF